MKTYIGVFILVLLLVAASGCTSQPAKPAATVTAVVTTAAATEVPTAAQTPAPTTAATAVATQVPTAIATTEAATSATTVATPLPSMTPSTKLTVIHIKNNAFVPDTLTVLPGTMITWTNDDSATHVVKATGDAAGKFTSADLIQGGQFTYTFGETTGIYTFADPKYPNLKGAIVVKNGETLYEAGLGKVTSAPTP